MTLAWNLLFYESFDQFAVDSQVKPKSGSGSTLEPVTVIQFNQKSPGYWVMIIANPYEFDPSSYSARLALQYFPGTQFLNFSNAVWIVDPKGIKVLGGAGGGDVFFANGIPEAAIYLQPVYDLNALLQGAVPTSTVHSLWYLIGYPNQLWQNFDVDYVGNAVQALGNTAIAQSVVVYADTSSNSVQPLEGQWVLIKVLTVMDTLGRPITNSALNLDGWLRLIYDFTANTNVFTLFPRTNHLQILDLSGAIIYDGVPVVNRRPISGNPVIPLPLQNAPYFALGVYFDGQTGVVSYPPPSPRSLNDTTNSSQISFAGWFNADWSTNGPNVQGNATAKLEFSQGDNSSNSIKVDEAASDFTTTVQNNAWFHLMGTIDGATGKSVQLLNGRAVGTATVAGSPFSVVLTNDTQVYIGTDGQGNFFTGNICDLSIWFDFSFISGSTIPQSTIDLFIDPNSGKPVDPRIAVGALHVAPDFMVSGPAGLPSNVPGGVGTTQIEGGGGGASGYVLNPSETFLIQGLLPLAYVSGQLGDSSTSPSQGSVI